jgi:antitoxin ParD1/3/4
MPTRTVVLTARQARMIERLVASGRYRNASEVLREGLRLIEQREAEDEARLAALREAARIGIEDIAAGRYRSFATAEAASEYLEALTEQILARDDADE